MMKRFGLWLALATAVVSAGCAAVPVHINVAAQTPPGQTPVCRLYTWEGYINGIAQEGQALACEGADVITLTQRWNDWGFKWNATTAKVPQPIAP